MTLSKTHYSSFENATKLYYNSFLKDLFLDNVQRIKCIGYQTLIFSGDDDGKTLYVPKGEYRIRSRLVKPKSTNQIFTDLSDCLKKVGADYETLIKKASRKNKSLVRHDYVFRCWVKKKEYSVVYFHSYDGNLRHIRTSIASGLSTQKERVQFLQGLFKKMPEPSLPVGADDLKSEDSDDEELAWSYSKGGIISPSQK